MLIPGQSANGPVSEAAQKQSAAAELLEQAKRLGYNHIRGKHIDTNKPDDLAVKFVTAQDPVIRTCDGKRLPVVPVAEAVRLKKAQDVLLGHDPNQNITITSSVRETKDGALRGVAIVQDTEGKESGSENVSTSILQDVITASQTHPLFPVLPLYGPPSPIRGVLCLYYRITSSVLSLCFLGTIVLGAIFTHLINILKRIWIRLKGGNSSATRPFFEEEEKRKVNRAAQAREWTKKAHRVQGVDGNAGQIEEDRTFSNDHYTPLEGGPDPLSTDARFYARRVGLEMEEFEIQTEDGFVITLWHLYDPSAYTPTRPSLQKNISAELLHGAVLPNGVIVPDSSNLQDDGNKKYPVLMCHGLLQSAGAYCCSDDDSLAFYLAKAGYDVWLGNNRCGVRPSHSILNYNDPRMWAWNIRQMAVMDLPAFIARVLAETGFEKLALICHSQGTTQALVALAKEQRPDIGERISVFCALAPAAYAGPLIDKAYFKFMQVLTPRLFRTIFGIHSFIPFMMEMHRILPRRLYGYMGYLVFSFLFSWSDERWDRDLRDRFFQFSPVYVSSESMMWWLGRDCFAKQRCILATKHEHTLEDEEDEEEEAFLKISSNREPDLDELDGLTCDRAGHDHKDRGRYAWFDERVPPFAVWVGGRDKLVDGARFLRRFERGREPHVQVVHKKIIEEYEHLDVIWAIDSIEQVGKEVKEVIWKTAPKAARRKCKTPVGCESIEV